MKALLLAALLGPAATAAAQVAHPPADTVPQEPADTTPVDADSASDPLAEIFLEEEMVLRLGAGTGRYPDEPRLPNVTGSSMSQFGLSVPFRASPWLGVELEYFGGDRTFSTEGSEWWIFTVDDETSMTVTWINLAGRLNVPPVGPIRGYVSTGIAAAFVELRTSGTAVGFPVTAQSDSDEALTLVAGAGLQLVLGPVVLHADYRQSRLRVDLEDYGLVGLKTGGRFLMFGAGLRGVDWVPDHWAPDPR